MNRKFLEDLNLDKETVDKILDENSRDIVREKQKAEQAKSDLAEAQEQLAQRGKDLEELTKSAGGVEEVKRQLKELQDKYTADTEAYQKQLAERDYADAMTRAITDKGIKFSSKAAERAYIADLKAKGLELKDGALVGFDAYHKAQMEADPTAFQTDKPTPTFVKPIGMGGQNIQTKTDGERLAESIGRTASATAKASSDIISMYTGRNS